MAIQRELASAVCSTGPRRKDRLIAGLDCAVTGDGSQCIAGVVVWDCRTGETVEESVALRPIRFPYVPGLLSFREAPALLAALRRLRCEPDSLMCDGHGFAHPRRFGIACHIGVLCRRPAIGCAKSRLVGVYHEPGRRRGARTSLEDGRDVIGSVLRTRDVVRPVYVSVGHRIDLRSAERTVLQCAIRYRLPEPTRLADLLVGRVKREL
jgi:deoxyribonuclease V